MSKIFVWATQSITNIISHRFADGVALLQLSVLPPHLGLVHSVKDHLHPLHSSDLKITEMNRKKGKVKKENDKNAMNVGTCSKHRYNPTEVDQFRSLLLPW